MNIYCACTPDCLTSGCRRAAANRARTCRLWFRVIRIGAHTQGLIIATRREVTLLGVPLSSWIVRLQREAAPGIIRRARERMGHRDARAPRVRPQVPRRT